LIRTSILDNGIRLVSEQMSDVHSLAIGVWVGTGSRDESDQELGTSHFLEHMLFKGTDTRSAKEIAQTVDAKGGDMNAFTTKEYTAFYIRILSEHLDIALDILCDMLTNPALNSNDVDAEREVILDEILMHEDEPADLVGDLFSEALFPDHPLGRDVAGTAASVSLLDSKQLRRFFERHYQPENMVVAAAGAVDHDGLCSNLTKRFLSRHERHVIQLGYDGQFGQVEYGEPFRLRQPTVSKARLLVTRQKPIEQGHIIIGVKTFPCKDQRRWALAILNHTLGGGISSRLFQEIREEKGLAYSIWSENAYYSDTGFLSVSLGTAPKHAMEVTELVLKEISSLSEHGINRNELALSRDHLKADMLLSYEDSNSRMGRIGHGLLLHGEVLTVEQILTKIDSVTIDQVQSVAADVFQQKPTIAVVGPPNVISAFEQAVDESTGLSGLTANSKI
jgi:predicted Zn-dependent peptidase